MCYSWSIIRILKLYHILRSWQVGKPIIQHYYDEVGDIENLIQESEYDSEKAEQSQTSIPDRALLIAQASSLFKLEIALTCSTQCQNEVYALLSNDQLALEDVSDRIYYKSYYQASKFHGKIQLNRVRHCNNVLWQTHVSLRELLNKRNMLVSFDTYSLEFARLTYNLALKPENTNITDKCSLGKHWEAAGFQGEDPSTDFRGVGEFGLHQLDYFCRHHPLYAQRMIQESGTLLTKQDVEQAWYPFALCSIHVSKLVCTLLERGTMQQNLLQAGLQGRDGVAQFVDDFYSFCFLQCHLDWAEGVDKKEITSVFQFEEFFADYSAYLTRQLEQKVWHNDDFHPHVKWW